ncbi:acyl carrier protein [Photobacterium aphoticum]|uniref:Acyl carrier protein n=1 Tax=Photobacterium aphoticum TaxID=754436 RepID=A0A090QRI3_9GAMM|nr:acyl carrier protein [Photobacterium aphoticum]
MMEALHLELKALIIETLNLEEVTVEDIDTEAPLFHDGLGLDSIDALELGMAIKNQYCIVVDAQDASTKAIFQSVATLAQFIEQQRR